MIYFLQDSNSHAIKIGYAADPEGRAASLQTGNSAELVLLLTMPGERALESQFHQSFAAWRIAGEWFRPAPTLLQFILSVANQAAHARGQESGAKAARAELLARQQITPLLFENPDTGVPLCALWKMTGEEANDSGGGECSFHAVTDNYMTPPDALAAYAAVRASNYQLYRINTVELVYEYSPGEPYGALIHDQRTRPATPARELGL